VNGLGFAGYYTAGREAGSDPNATRSASLEGSTGFPNFLNYVNSHNISPSSIGFGYGQKSGLDFTKSWNLGEDKLGQDWFARPDSPIEERIYRANPNNVQFSLYDGTTKIINLGYSDVFFVADNGSSPSYKDNFNVFLSDPVPVSKVAGLDPLASGLADAFLQDVAAAGGSIQLVSEENGLEAEFSVNNGFAINTIGAFPLELRAVSSTSVPEPSSVLGLLMFGALGAVARMTQRKNKQVF